jgi:hypothetical protein
MSPGPAFELGESDFCFAALGKLVARPGEHVPGACFAGPDIAWKGRHLRDPIALVVFARCRGVSH